MPYVTMHVSYHTQHFVSYWLYSLESKEFVINISYIISRIMCVCGTEYRNIKKLKYAYFINIYEYLRYYTSYVLYIMYSYKMPYYISRTFLKI